MSNIKLKQSAGSGTVTLKAAASGSNDVELTLPNDIGSNDQYLKLSGVSGKTGELSFDTPSGGAALTGSTNNTITTVTGANAIQGEANLTYNGSTLKFGNSPVNVICTTSSDASDDRYILMNAGGDGSDTRGAMVSLYGNEVGSWEGRMELHAGNSGSANGNVRVYTGGSSRLEVASGGDVTVKTGNLVIGTSGKGIDFSTGAGGDATSNLLDEYEEGTFTSTLKYNNTSDCGFSTSPAGGTDIFYTKIGRLVHVHGYIKGWTMNSGDGSNATITLPFAVTGGRNQAPGSVAHYTCFNHGTVRCIAEVSTNRLDFFQDNSTSRTTWNSGSSNYLMFGVTYHTDT